MDPQSVENLNQMLDHDSDIREVNPFIQHVLRV